MGPILITPAGRALIAADVERLQQEVWLRQLLKYKLPSPLEHGAEYEAFDVMPYRLTLKVVYELHRRGHRGITKEEIALFLITAVRNDEADRVVERVLEYREERDRRVGLVAKRAFFSEQRERRVREIYAEEFEREHALLRRVVRAHRAGDRQAVGELLTSVAAGGKGGRTKKAQAFVREAMQLLRNGRFDDLRQLFDRMRFSVRGGTLGDYADTTVRYSAITSLFSLSGNKMVLIAERLPLIERLIAEGFPSAPDRQYLDHFYADNAPHLPTDDADFLRVFVAQLEQRRETLRAEAQVEPVVRERPPVGATLLDLKRYQLELETENAEYKEVLFYRAQSTPEAIQDIHRYFAGIRQRDLMGGETYLPAFLEWTSWRVFLAINRLAGPVSKTRNFRLDEELNPVHHAKGGVADTVFDYDDYTMVVEVTLNTSERQWSAEAEPVPRHVARVMEERDRPVYCLFVAPTIHPDTAHTFLRSELSVRGQFRRIHIVPLTLEQLERLLNSFAERRFGPAELRVLTEGLLALREGCADGREWLQRLSEHFATWIRGRLAA
jgi:hypothetical protein